jgi:uncharacterized membrane protein YkvA (DUF1232 family)
LNINFEDVKGQFGEKAKEYANDKEKSKKLVDEAFKKANREKGKKGPIDDIWEKVQLLFSLIKDWASGDYKDVPTGSVVLILIGILYFVSPLDFIPDFIPIAGFVDDGAVLLLVFKQLNSDLEKYKDWTEARSH